MMTDTKTVNPPPALSDVAEIRWLEDLEASDTDTAGGKGANLGELARFGMPVPPAFVVTAAAFRRFLDQAGLGSEIANQLTRLNVDDGQALREAAEELQQQVRGAPVPEDLRSPVATPTGRWRVAARCPIRSLLCVPPPPSRICRAPPSPE